MSSLEKRWKQYEHPILILALFLNPKYRNIIRGLNQSTRLTRKRDIIYVARCYHARFFKDKESAFKMALANWLSAENDFVIRSDFIEAEEDPIIYWNVWNSLKTQETTKQLGYLAIFVLSVACQTASVEELFSVLANIHSAERNRMNISNVNSVQMLKGRVHKKNENSKKGISKIRIIDPTEKKIGKY